LAIDNETLITLAADIVVAHVTNNNVATADITGLIENVYGALATLGTPVETIPEKPKGAVSARASIKPDHLVSMLDGKPYKMLKRHLTLHGYTPQSYREAFDLPKDYPMVAASYAEKRRDLAKKIGLGRRATAAVEPAVVPKPARKPRAKKTVAAVPTQT
jgi:predicted transcriptional regulator